MSEENKPSQMLRVPTPLVDAVRELSRLHRQGKTSEVLAGLDDLIVKLDGGSSQNSTFAPIVQLGDTPVGSDCCHRLNNLESQLSGLDDCREVLASKRIQDLESKIDGINHRLHQFAEAIVQLQSSTNHRSKRGNSYNSSYQGQAVKFQPITEASLASRLGVTPENLRQERESQPPPLFFAWCKRRDTSGIGWEFDPKTGLYKPIVG